MRVRRLVDVDRKRALRLAGGIEQVQLPLARQQRHVFAARCDRGGDHLLAR